MAEQLEVRELVRAAVAERDTVVNLETAVRAATNTRAVTLADTLADLAPRPAVPDLPPLLPIVVPATSSGGGSPAMSSSSRSGPRCAEARSSASGGETWSCSTGASTFGRRLCAARPSRRKSVLTEDDGDRPAHRLVLDEVWKTSRYRGDDDLVVGHPLLGTPVDPSKLSRDQMRPALRAAGINKRFRPWHDLRYTALTHEAAGGNPHAYVQAKAGHSQSTITDRYIHAAQVLFPGAAEKAGARMFGPTG